MWSEVVVEKERGKIGRWGRVREGEKSGESVAASWEEGSAMVSKAIKEPNSRDLSTIDSHTRQPIA